MMPTQYPGVSTDGPEGDTDPDSLDALLRSSRRMGRFWPPSAAGPRPAVPAPTGVHVPARAQRLVAAMAEYS